MDLFITTKNDEGFGTANQVFDLFLDNFSESFIESDHEFSIISDEGVSVAQVSCEDIEDGNVASLQVSCFVDTMGAICDAVEDFGIELDIHPA